MMMLIPIPGEVKVSIIKTDKGTFQVQVQEFKENTLRGDAYWVNKVFRTYNKQKDAIKFAVRFTKI